MEPPDAVALSEREREGLRELYLAHKDNVYSVALYFFHGNEAAAADATQQVFLKLAKSLGTFRGQGDFSAWLRRLVVNVCLDGARRTSARREASPEILDALPGAQSHEDDLARRQHAGEVRAAVVSLPAKLRLPILLRYIDDLSYAEMARALECSAGTVASRLSRGHRLLAQKLDPARRGTR